MPNEPIAPYESPTAIKQHRKAVKGAIGRLQHSLEKNEESMRRTSIRVDDLRTLLDHVEALKADIFEAQKAALEEAIGSIEFMADITAECNWKDCVTLIRVQIEQAEQANNPTPMRRTRKPRT